MSARFAGLPRLVLSGNSRPPRPAAGPCGMAGLLNHSVAGLPRLVGASRQVCATDLVAPGGFPFSAGGVA